MVKKAIIIGLCLGLFLRLAFAATPVTFQYHYDEKGQLVTVEDSTGKVLQYVYDPVGNLLATITATQTTKPTITGIVPNTLRQGQSAAVTLSGSALLGARVISPSSALAVGNVQPGKNSVSFNLTAEVAAPLGAQNFNLMTNAGSTGFSITVKPLLPAILVSPWVNRGVEHTPFDHTSVLKYLIEKWSLGAPDCLGDRTASANSIARVLDSGPDRPREDTTAFIRVPFSQLIPDKSELDSYENAVNENQASLHLLADFINEELDQTSDGGIAAVASALSKEEKNMVSTFGAFRRLGLD